jgi:hypothetical protein
MNKETIIAGVVGVGILGAMIANNRGNATIDDDDDPVCGAGEELVDGECVPITTTPTTTVTSSVTSSVTNTMTTPVTVTSTL